MNSPECCMNPVSSVKLRHNIKKKIFFLVLKNERKNAGEIF
jgi:hypothetical protein